MRLDQLLFARGLVPSRAVAQRLITEGAVLVNGEVVQRAATPIAESDTLELVHGTKFVSRGGDKLEAALQAWRIPVEGRVCLDVGAGTGGFTDCLLQRGAAKVYAFDVGHAQLHPSLQGDSRVVSREGVNCRALSPEEMGEPVQLIVVDVSFISLALILPAIAACLQPGGELVALVKPQFESGPEAAERGRGIIKDPKLHRSALEKVRTVAQQVGLQWRAEMPSPLLGGDGNREFLAWLSAG